MFIQLTTFVCLSPAQNKTSLSTTTSTANVVVKSPSAKSTPTAMASNLTAEVPSSSPMRVKKNHQPNAGSELDADHFLNKSMSLTLSYDDFYQLYDQIASSTNFLDTTGNGGGDGSRSPSRQNQSSCSNKSPKTMARQYSLSPAKVATGSCGQISKPKTSPKPQPKVAQKPSPPPDPEMAQSNVDATLDHLMMVTNEV